MMEMIKNNCDNKTSDDNNEHDGNGGSNNVIIIVVVSKQSKFALLISYSFGVGPRE